MNLDTENSRCFAAAVFMSIYDCKRKTPPAEAEGALAGDEGFEPPKTESEAVSGSEILLYLQCFRGTSCDS